MNRTDLRAWRSKVQHLPLTSSHIVQATLFLCAFIKELKTLPGIEHSSKSNSLEPLPPLPTLSPLLCQLWKSLCPLSLAGVLEALGGRCLILAPCPCSQIGSLPSGTPADYFPGFLALNVFLGALWPLSVVLFSLGVSPGLTCLEDCNFILSIQSHSVSISVSF